MASINLLRGILVASAAVAAVVAAAVGLWLAATVLVVAVLVHGGFTLYLRRPGQTGPPSGGTTPTTELPQGPRNPSI